MLLGASLQAGLAILVPSIYAFLPAVALLAFRLLDAYLISLGLKRNPYLQDVSFKRTTAMVRDKDGEFPEAGQEKITILLLGAKSNHPFGVLAPGFRKMNLSKMTKNMHENAANNGFLGQTGYMRTDERGALEFNFISYWRSIEDLHAFAHGPIHRETWVWWEKTLKQHDFLGVNHEIYEADKGRWENVYLNFQPTGLGATTFLRKGDKLEGGIVDDSWVSPLVDVSKGKYRTSAGRLGWAPTKHDATRPNLVDY